MNLKGPIIIIEDDPEEAMILRELIQDIASWRQVITIPGSASAIEFLSQCDKPFLILSGINLQGLNGFQLRELILSDHVLARKCTPYIFYAAHSHDDMLTKVYDLQASGYFHDITDYNDLGNRLSMIIRYWEHCGA